MKKIKFLVNKMMPAYILSFAFCFMLFLIEPITLYANNIDDFWFDIYIMILPVLLLFFTCFIVISLIYTIIYILNKHFFKNINIYNFSTIIFFIFFIYLYIQGNYLAGDLPILDGTEIKWDKYFIQNIISTCIFIMLVIVQVVLLIKLKMEKCIKIVKYVSLAVVAMLSTSSIGILLTTNIFVYKETPAEFTARNINVASSNTNFFIFIADNVDSVYFKKALNSSEKYKYTFDDFTYYPDTLGAYPYTKNAVPFILSGIWNEYETAFREYSTNALNESKLLNFLNEEKYIVNLYEPELVWEDEKVWEIANTIPLERKTNISKFIKQELKYILFKYLPYNFKKYSRINDMDFNYAKPIKETYNYVNQSVYNVIKNNDIEIVKDKIFNLLHIEGGHAPFDQDENLDVISNGTYEQKLLGVLKIIDTYLNRLKEYDVYDNSVIIIMADHGFNFDDSHGRQNPILFIKGINEHHSMITSEKSISFEDLQDAYFELLDGKSSKSLFKNISKKRERRYLYYDGNNENHMYEYIQTGKAWDEKTLEKTGKEYVR